MLTTEQMEKFRKELEQQYPKGVWEAFEQTYENRRDYFLKKAMNFKNPLLSMYLFTRLLSKNPLIHVEVMGEKQKKLYYSIHAFFEKEHVEALFYSHYDSYPLLQATGSKSLEIKKILEQFDGFSVYHNGQIIKNEKRFDFDWSFSIDPSYHFVTAMKKRNGVIIEKKKLTSVQKTIEYLEPLLSASEKMKEIENSFLPFIRKYDPTVYMKEDQLLCFIYGNSFALYIKQTVTKKGEIVYKGRVGTKYVQSKDLSIVREKMEKEIMNYITKHRVKAAIAGKSNQFLSRFIYHLIQKQTIDPSFEKWFDTTLTEDHLNRYLKEHIDSTMKIPLSNDEIEYYQQQFKKQGKRRKIKTGYQYGKFIVLISGTKIHLFPEKNIA